MTDKHYEHLSALVDGEDVDDSVLASVLADDAQKEALHRYQLASSIIRNEAQPGVAIDISAAVAARVAQEPVHNVTVAALAKRGSKAKPKAGWSKSAANDSWWRPAVSVAVAASVALVAVIGVQNYQLDPAETGTQSSPSVGPVFETSPLSGMASPVSFNAVQEAPMLEEASQGTDQRRYIQSFFVDHQQQTQLSQQDKDETDREAPSIEKQQ